MNSNRLLSLEVMISLGSGKGSLSSLLNQLRQSNPDANLSIIREYTYGVCRWYHQLAFISGQLVEKPLRKKDQDLQMLILLGLYQLYHMRTADHAAINETVDLVKKLKKDWARSLVNAVLRNAQRQQKQLQSAATLSQSANTSHPDWLIAKFRQDWPEDYENILTSNNIQAPMTLRVNLQKTNQKDYLKTLETLGLRANPGLYAQSAVVLEKPADVAQLPGFAEGLVSVQDEASQLAAQLLELPPGARVLDACSAPGGKTCALLEQYPSIKGVIALDNNEARLVRVNENLERLGLQATLLCADAADPDSWWDGEPFDAILLDAPCTGTGVIRRHPDIKLLREPQDVPRLNELQQQLLMSLWPCLKNGGRLLYATCSVLKNENIDQVEAFVAKTPGANIIPINNPAAVPCKTGMQFLPGQGNMDGFYYALLEKA